MKIYYSVLTCTNGVWSVQFGDYTMQLEQYIPETLSLIEKLGG